MLYVHRVIIHVSPNTLFHHRRYSSLLYIPPTSRINTNILILSRYVLAQSRVQCSPAGKGQQFPPAATLKFARQKFSANTAGNANSARTVRSHLETPSCSNPSYAVVRSIEDRGGDVRITVPDDGGPTSRTSYNRVATLAGLTCIRVCARASTCVFNQRSCIPGDAAYVYAVVTSPYRC